MVEIDYAYLAEWQTQREEEKRLARIASAVRKSELRRKIKNWVLFVALIGLFLLYGAIA